MSQVLGLECKVSDFGILLFKAFGMQGFNLLGVRRLGEGRLNPLVSRSEGSLSVAVSLFGVQMWVSIFRPQLKFSLSILAPASMWQQNVRLA